MDQIREDCRRFGISGVRTAIPLPEGFANLNYRVQTDQGDFLYRVCLQQPDVKLILWEIDLLRALQKFDFPTAYMLATDRKTDQRTDRNTEQKDCLIHTDHGRVMIYEFKDGHEPELNPKTVDEIARALARLSLFSDWEKFPRKNVITMDDCLDLVKAFKTAPVKYPEVFEYFEAQTLFLKPFVDQDLPRGIIHGDCFPNNTIFQGDTLVAIIDFEEACVDHLLMDIGMTINGFCFKDNELDPMLMNVFLKAYNKVRPLIQKEIELLPHYIQWGAHGMISWHLRHYLMDRRNEKQLERVMELMNRVKALRNTKSLKIEV